MSTIRFIAVLVLAISTTVSLTAQRPDRGDGDRGGGDRGGGDRGGRGGFDPSGGGFGPPGGGFGPPGGGFGPPGGGFGPPGGGDRGGRGGFGGPPGGGPPGGGPGGRGGPGGSRGGFDPSSFLSRLDANGNGMIDPDEQQGPAQFIIQRLQQSDPSIRPGQPISLKKITDGFQQMREGAGGGDNNGDDRRRDSRDDDALMPELLVPGFGLEGDVLPTPLMGFGAAAEMLSVAVTAQDEQQANEMMQRMDRNRDGVLSGDELSRFSGDPLDFDRNRDGKLTPSELAVRYARRREAGDESRANDDRRREPPREDSVEIPDVFNGRNSYRPTSSRRLPSGLPGFFGEKDTNRDGQLTMAEFAEEWSDEVVNQFFVSDLNRDGVITADEALRAVETPGGVPMASMASSPTTAGDASAGGGPTGPIDDKYIKVGQRIIERYDKNNDRMLTASEWEKMLMSPADADGNRDGRITIEEYAVWMQARERK